MTAKDFFAPVNLGLTIVFLLLVAVFIAQACQYWIAIIDDSYITFRFVDMFVKGYGWRFSPDGPKVEGFTNFLWAAILVIPHALGWDLMLWAKVLGMTCGVATMAASWGFARAVRGGRNDLLNLIPSAIFATSPHFAQWGMMGLETLLQCALVTATFWRFEVERRDLRCHLLSPFLAVLAAITRFDSLWYMSPLGLYGGWLVLAGRIPLRRYLRWGVYAALPFAVFYIWKVSYFGDLLPNTFYAKDRLIGESDRNRAIQQIHSFYLAQGEIGQPIQRSGNITLTPTPPGENSTLHYLKDLGISSFAWITLWGSGALFCVLAMGMTALLSLFVFLRKERVDLYRTRDPELTDDVHIPKIFFLLLLPWAMSVYYIYRVDGDWMPGFRFFQVAYTFIGVSVAVGWGYMNSFLSALSKRLAWRFTVNFWTTAATFTLLFFVARELFMVNTVYIFGKTYVNWIKRDKDWWHWKNITGMYNRGFVPPLNDVANFLLMNTKDDSWLFMGDIGQPLWYSEHLSLYDADGLTDPYLAHAPSTRGRLPTYGELKETVRAEWKMAHPTTAEKKRIEDEAHRRDFDGHIRRNADLMMTKWRPEYIVLFINHTTSDPKSTGYAYPQIAEAIYRHPAFADYVEMGVNIKIANAYNHYYRRKDMPDKIPDNIKLARIWKAIDRNPRLPLLAVLLFREASKMNLNPEERKRIDEFVAYSIERWKDDPIITELTAAAQQVGAGEATEKLLREQLRKNPKNIAAYWSLAGSLQQRGEYNEAIVLMTEADKLAGGKDVAIVYHLTWLHGMVNDVDGALAMAQRGIDMTGDSRPWFDYSYLADRAAKDTRMSKEKRLAYAEKAITGFETLLTFPIENAPDIRAALASVQKIRRELSGSADVVGEPEPMSAAMATAILQIPGSLAAQAETRYMSAPVIVRNETSYTSMPATPAAETSYQPTASRAETKY